MSLPALFFLFLVSFDKTSYSPLNSTQGAVKVLDDKSTILCLFLKLFPFLQYLCIGVNMLIFIAAIIEN